MVAIMHTDTRVRTGDMRARMPRKMEIKGRTGQGNIMVAIATPNALSMRATRFRNKAGLLPRETRGGSVKIEEYIRNFYPQKYLDANNSIGHRDLTDEEVEEMKEGNFGQYGNKARMYNRVAKMESANESSGLFVWKLEPNLTRSAPTASTLRRSGRRVSTHAQASRTRPTRKQPPRASKHISKNEPSSPGLLTPKSTKFEDCIGRESMDDQEVIHDDSILDDDSLHLDDEESQYWDIFLDLPATHPSRMETDEETMEPSQTDPGFLPVNQMQDHTYASGAPRFQGENSNPNNAYSSENVGSLYRPLAIGAVRTNAHESKQSFRQPFFGSTSHRGMVAESPRFRTADNNGLVNHQQSDFTLPPSIFSPMTDEFPAIHSDPHPLARYFDPRNALYDTDSFNVDPYPEASAPILDSNTVTHKGLGHPDTSSFNAEPYPLAPAPIWGLNTVTRKSLGHPDTSSFNVEPYPLAAAPVLGPRTGRQDRRGRNDNKSFNGNLRPLAPAPFFGSSPAKYDSRGHTDINSVNGGPRRLAPAPVFGLSTARPDSRYRPQGHDSGYQPRLLENALSSNQASMDENIGLDNGGNNEFVPQRFLGSRGVPTPGYQAFHTRDTNNAANRSLGEKRSSRPSRPMGFGEHRSIPRGSRLDRRQFENELGSHGVEMSGYQAYNTSRIEGLANHQSVAIDTSFTNQTRRTSTLAPYVSQYEQGNHLRKRHEDHDGGVPTGVMKPHDATSEETPKMGQNNNEVDLMQYEDAQWGQSQNPQASITGSAVQGQVAGNAAGSMQGVQNNDTNQFGYSADELRQIFFGGMGNEDLSSFDFDGLSSMDEYEGPLFDPQS